MLAPDTVQFFNSTFEPIGSKSFLLDLVVAATRIDRSRIWFRRHIEAACVAERIIWASQRVTCREEDVAYCLIGLLNVNMPLPYGEGRIKAFVGLQLEIVKKSDDESIFAWRGDGVQEEFVDWRGLLAPSPAAFDLAYDIDPRVVEGVTVVPCTFLEYRYYRYPYAMTNKGLEFTFEIPKISNTGNEPRILWPPHCKRFTVKRDGTRIEQRIALLVTSYGRAFDFETNQLSRECDLVFGNHFDFEQKSGCDAVVGGVGAREGEIWKVYFEQSGL